MGLGHCMGLVIQPRGLVTVCPVGCRLWISVFSVTLVYPNIETHRSISKKPLLALTNNTIQAVMSDCPLLAIKLPVFDLNNTLEITNFILNTVGLYKN